MCYIVPMSGAIVTSLIWHKKKELKLWWLNLMFYGGALFGVIDHLWNGELFLISENILGDLLLGVVISLAIFVFWFIILALSKMSPVLSHYVDIKAGKVGS